jgi:hypothetical protein
MSIKEELGRRWSAWQISGSTSAEVAALKTEFRNVIAAVANGSTVSADLESLVDYVKGELPGIAAAAVAQAETFDGNIILYRGIQDEQAQEILQCMAKGQPYQFPDDWPRSFATRRSAARGFAHRGAWGGVSVRVELPTAAIVFAPGHFGFQSELDGEAEVLVASASRVVLRRENFDAASLGQARGGTGAGAKERLAKRPLLEVDWQGRLSALGMSNEQVAAALSSFQIR